VLDASQDMPRERFLCVHAEFGAGDEYEAPLEPSLGQAGGFGFAGPRCVDGFSGGDAEAKVVWTMVAGKTVWRAK